MIPTDELIFFFRGVGITPTSQSSEANQISILMRDAGKITKMAFETGWTVGEKKVHLKNMEL